jgi:CheY-like chemotaxis protein
MRQYQSVILLIDGKAANICFVKEWFKKSRFLTCETRHISQALEEISDFTVRRRPDVILLEVDSLADDFFIFKKILHTSFDGNKLLICALSDSGKTINHKECFEGNLSQLKVKLNQIFPKPASVRHAAAIA